ncbi:MopE-related protein [Psychroserpens jangbogonensis]|uniref:MopE-related protein n=1 Tax=Psychroserpens jangbogonensis TaxID=1484460 RepID=UPI00068E143D|nr:MopE-related protein [Psychroserpens jangbogonensis]
MTHKLYTILITLLVTAITFAQAPEKMSYQAVVRDTGNAIVSNQAVGMQISILQGTTAVYVETQTPTTNANGLVSIQIGMGSVVSGDFSAIDWSAGPYFIKTETDPTGGTTYTITGTSELLSVPYALHATTAESLTNTFSYYYADVDDDGYGDKWQVIYSPNPPAGFVIDNTDCNDTDVSLWEPQTYYVDSDGDGFGSTTSELFCESSAPIGYSDNDLDCNDSDATVNLDATEICDGIDNNCNGEVDEGLVMTTYYVDGDGDGFGSTTSEMLCESSAPSGYSDNDLDCNDSDATVNPNATEICGNGVDNNCDGIIDNCPANIGDFRDGGVVFWVDPTDNTQGLVCAIEDQSSGIRWRNGTTSASNVVTGATFTAIGMGSANTDAIIAVQGSVETNYAAGLAREGTDGWYLPNKDELNEMYVHKSIIDYAATSNGGTGFSEDWYWSSTEEIYTDNRAWHQNFLTGTQITRGKGGQDYVRAVKAFPTPPAAIGDLRAGGVVFWVNPLNNQHGLVCALTDAGVIEWSCLTDLPNVPNVTTFPPSGSGAEIGDGFNNTHLALLDCPTATAAILARNDGSVWFLPSINELNEMYSNKSILEAVAGFSAFSAFYWSSTEIESSGAWRQDFDNGSQFNGFKGFSGYVRAVRAF